MNSASSREATGFDPDHDADWRVHRRRFRSLRPCRGPSDRQSGMVPWVLPCRQQWFDVRHGSVAVGRLSAHAVPLGRSRWLVCAVLARASSSPEGSRAEQKKKKRLSSQLTDSVVGREWCSERDEATQERSSGAVSSDQPLGSRIGGECLGSTDAELTTGHGC
jgi:hypothetical protein